MKKLLLISAAIFLLTIGGVLTYVLLSVDDRAIVMPDPNGYVTLIEAASIHARSNNPEELSGEELKRYLEDNRATLELIEIALTQTSRVPLSEQPSRFNNLGGLKSLAWLLEAEGRAALESGDPRTAADSYLEAVRLGAAVGQGGPMIDRLVGIACQAIGLQQLQLLPDRLSSGDREAMARALREIHKQAETVEETIENERLWVKRTYKLHQVLFAELMWAFPNSPTRKAEDSFRAQVTRITSDMEACIAKLEERVEEPEFSK